MRFLSKASNYRVTLKPGQRGEPVTGRLPVAGLYVKFEYGEAQIPEYGMGGYTKDEIIEMLKRHPSFGKDFHLIEDEKPDPYAYLRKASEPEHTIVQMERGAIAGVINPRPKLKLEPAQRKVVDEMVKEQAKTMAKEMAKEMLKELAAQKKEVMVEGKEDGDNEVEDKEDTVENEVKEEMRQKKPGESKRGIPVI